MVKIFACGVNEYRGCSNLSFCVNDATVFCKTFAKNFMVDEIEVIAENGNVTNWEYCNALHKFCVNIPVQNGQLSHYRYSS